ncbi:hypothetical protein BDV97DRAFT_203149 [Delphinella strobiligena]|nr:hypothetical protein BDV97DRAFT_203149 [Delphinella strobiligena]
MPSSYAPRRPAGLPSSTPQSVVEDASESELEQEDSNQSLVAVTSRQPESLTATQLATRAGIQPNSRLMARLQSSTTTISTSAWHDYQPPVQRPTGPTRGRGRSRMVTELAADPLPAHHLKREDSTDETPKSQKERRTTRAHVPRAVFMPEIFQSRSGSQRSLRFDANGQPLPKRKPGRPRVRPAPEDRQDRARTSSLLSLGPVVRSGSTASSASVLGKRRASTAFNDAESDTGLKKRRKPTLASLQEDDESDAGNKPKRRRRATLAFPLTEVDSKEDDEIRKDAAAAAREGNNEEDDSDDELALPSKPTLKVILKLPKRHNLAVASSGPTEVFAPEDPAAPIPTPTPTAHPLGFLSRRS